MKVSALILTALIGAGCARHDDATQPENRRQAASSANRQQEPKANSPVVRVNGQMLTYGEAQQRLNSQLAAIRGQIPEDQLPLVRTRLLEEIRKQFVTRVLLTAEADAQHIDVTEADEAEAMKTIQEKLPDGVRIEEVMTNSPSGADHLRAELLVGIRINKLLTAYTKDKLPTITAEEVAAYRARNQRALILPESVRARHILIAVEPDADEATRQEKRALAEEVRKKLIEGAAFEDMATQYSSCPSKKRGGDLGRFQRGRMVKAFEDAAFSQDVQAIGRVVETRFGYHVIQVTEHQSATELGDEVVRERVRNEKIKSLVDAYVNELKTRADIQYY